MIKTYTLIMIAWGNAWAIDTNLTIQDCAERAAMERQAIIGTKLEQVVQFRCEEEPGNEVEVDS